MLQIIRSFAELPLEQLQKIYPDEPLPLEYLQFDFFRGTNAVYAAWEVDGRIFSALRLEPYTDGYLIAGMQTDPAHRRNGYATDLLRAVIEYVNREGNIPLYSHILKKNAASLYLHRKCGFTDYLDFGRLLDGTVSSAYMTVIYR